MRRLITLLTMSLLTFPAAAKDIRIATWNMGWLTLRASEINGPNRDPNRAIYQRSDADFAKLKAYAKQLDADIVALQEVDTLTAATKVFDPTEYDIVLADETDFQRAGWAIRKTVRYTRMPDLAALDIHDGKRWSLRKGVDVLFHLPSGDLRALAVHLKSGCFSPKSQNDACPVLGEQMPIVSAWIDQRQTEGASLLVAGDFNRRLNKEDPLWKVLDNGPTPLVLATEGKANACWAGEYPDFIDQLVLGGPAASRIKPESFRVLTYTETEKADKKRISDHCPVSVEVR
ncbi:MULTISPECIES: endonuclease/exonuclease/phosphatase family protein [unclassified Azospirillum]|uniref:endonuclease/exonuclease/phosphatase family protein n=1 Tax=unclassified Azospirillum TaxID=2630922 RepID=UPI000B7526CF|nr:MULTISPECIES: endonuclease/exonuclease/phosphatase family protein [unclassified Azospirillum]SNS87955.1 Metal-dependent hydrolase, endonuclease/exonuclease/phosphatase family [Azospirillum sp. RU38E]SNT04915.1 Metal-dependent hydrolase, endonuclease/exonuclease/phosphatase family [Azospirillum sp. RU37A]